jgi:hypothetical protein
MFAFLCVAAGAAAGCGVCAFGMWAFLKGQSAALTVKWGGLPDAVLTHRTEKTGQNASPSLADQLGSMFNTERGN